MSAARGRVAWLSLCLALSALVGWLAWSSLFAVCYRVPPAALRAHERPARAPSVAPVARPARVVLVVLDGLRLDVSREMPYLDSLRSRGVDAIGLAPIPSLSRPGYATMATGAPPARSGVRNNAFPWQVELDTIFDRAKGAGLGTAGVANLSWWHQNYERGLDSWFSAVGLPLDQAEAMVRTALETRANLSLVHLANLDHIAHHEGVSAEYRSEARRLDATLSRVLSGVSLEDAALIVTSDHGHRDRGGHGGSEPEVVNVPLVLCGRGVKKQTVIAEPVGLGSVGPTLAVLLGLELPRDSSSRPLVAALDETVVGSQYLDVRLEDAAFQSAEYARRLALRAREQTRLAAFVPLTGDRELGGSLPGRGLALLCIAAAFVLVLRAARRGIALGPLLAAPLVGLGPVIALYLADLPWSHSAIVRIDLLIQVLAVGTIAGLVAHLSVLRLLAKPPETRLFHLRATAVGYVAVAPLLWLAFGYAHPTDLPGPFLLFAPLVAAFVGGATSVALGFAQLVSPRQSARMRSQAASSSTSTSDKSSRTML